MSQVFTLAEAAAGLIALAAIVALFCRFEGVGLFAVLGVYFVDAVFNGIPPVEVGAFNLRPQDLISVVLLITALVRLAFRRPTSMHVVWGIFAVMGFVSFYAGLQVYGTKASGVEFRQPLFLIANILYFSSFDFSEASLRRLKRAWFITAAGLISLAIYRWLAEWFGLPGMESWEVLRTSSPGRITRTLMAEQALFLFQAWLLTGPSMLGKRKRLVQVMSLVLLGFVLVLQHRTVWIAAVVTFIYLFGRIKTLLQRPVLLAAAVGGLCAMVLLVATADSSNQVATSLKYSILEPTADRSTLEWRVTSWQQLLGDDNSSGVRDALFGYRPYGAGMRRRVDGSIVNVSAHNFYIDTLMRTGMLGLAALLIGYGIILFQVRRERPGDDIERRNWRVVIVSILVGQFAYYFGYSAGYEQGILVGAAISFAMSRPTRVPVPGFSALEYRRRRGLRPVQGGQLLPEQSI
jgi:O-antigen ligase